MSANQDQNHQADGWRTSRTVVGAILFPFWPSDRELTHVTYVLYVLAAIGLIVTGFLVEKNVTSAIICALAIAATGALVGFLFGFPRTLRAASTPAAPTHDCRTPATG